MSPAAAGVLAARPGSVARTLISVQEDPVNRHQLLRALHRLVAPRTYLRPA